MDKPDQNKELLAGAFKAAKALGRQAKVVAREPALGRTHADALIEIRYGDHSVTYAADVKQTVTPATLGPIVHHLERLGEQAMLITGYVTPAVADKLHEQRIAF